jgi:isocitrate dehydrogenase
VSKEKVGTKEFAQAVVDRMGQKPATLKSVEYKNFKAPTQIYTTVPGSVKELVGIDVFVGWKDTANELASILQLTEGDGLKLDMISNRGTKVWPDGFPDTLTTDVYRCRFLKKLGSKTMTHATSVSQMGRIAAQALDIVKFESLYTFDGQIGYSLGQGQ